MCEYSGVVVQGKCPSNNIADVLTPRNNSASRPTRFPVSVETMQINANILSYPRIGRQLV